MYLYNASQMLHNQLHFIISRKPAVLEPLRSLSAIHSLLWDYDSVWAFLILQDWIWEIKKYTCVCVLKSNMILICQCHSKKKPQCITFHWVSGMKYKHWFQFGCCKSKNNFKTCFIVHKLASPQTRLITLQIVSMKMLRLFVIQVTKYVISFKYINISCKCWVPSA